MKAAVVNEFGKPPAYGDFKEPVAGDGEIVVRVHAAPLSPIVKLLASGTHYASGTAADFVPGVDGVGTDPEGRRVYFLFPKAPFGSMGEMSLTFKSMLVPIPDDASDVRAAAVCTAGLASWLALTRRSKLKTLCRLCTSREIPPDIRSPFAFPERVFIEYLRRGTPTA